MSETVPEFKDLGSFRDWFLSNPRLLGLELLATIDETHVVVKRATKVYRAAIVYDAGKTTLASAQASEVDMIIAYATDIDELDGKPVVALRQSEGAEQAQNSSIVKVIDGRKVARFQSGGRFYQHIYTTLPPTDFTEITDGRSFALYLKPEAAKEFMKEPYLVLPYTENARRLIVNRFLPLRAGWLQKQNGALNVFVVSRYVDFLNPLPKEIREALGLESRPPLKVKDDLLLTGKENQEWAFRRYIEYISGKVGDDSLRIKRGKKFNLISELIRDGILPFTPNPVAPDDLRDLPVSFEIRDYQREAWDEFLRFGAIGAFWPPGAGKSLFCVWACAKLKGRKLVVTKNNSIIEQFEDYFARYGKQGGLRSEVDLITYNSGHKVMEKEYTLAFFDEVQALPAKTFSSLNGVKAKYRIGVSATPWREDGLDYLIFALTGQPVGTNWERFRQLGVIKAPEITAIVVDSLTGKFRELDTLVRTKPTEGKTVIFSDSVDLGKQIAEAYKIPFIYGDTKNRLETIRQNQVFAISRVGDLGVSIKDLKRVIEVDFLLGSRTQEAQRMGRLLHSNYVGEHFILFTNTEYERYRKRLYGLFEKGFEVRTERR